MNLTLETLIAVGSFLTGVGGTLAAVLKWYRETQRKQFTAEREFNHLKRNTEQLSQALEALDERQEELMNVVTEMRGAVSAMLRNQGVRNVDLSEVHTTGGVKA